MNGNVLEITIKSQGKAKIILTATDSSGIEIVDAFQIEINKMGDINGDGVINSSDALFVFQVINGKVSISASEKLKFDMDGNGILNANDAALIMNAFSGQSSPLTQSNEYFVTIHDINDAPLVRDVHFSGELKVGHILTGTYQYMDIENDAKNSNRNS